jgi:hypothetical protein
MPGHLPPSSKQPASQPTSGYVQKVQNPFQDLAKEQSQKRAEEDRRRIQREQADARRAQPSTSQRKK